MLSPMRSCTDHLHIFAYIFSEKSPTRRNLYKNPEPRERLLHPESPGQNDIVGNPRFVAVVMILVDALILSDEVNNVSIFDGITTVTVVIFSVNF